MAEDLLLEFVYLYCSAEIALHAVLTAFILHLKPLAHKVIYQILINIVFQIYYFMYFIRSSQRSACSAILAKLTNFFKYSIYYFFLYILQTFDYLKSKRKIQQFDYYTFCQMAHIIYGQNKFICNFVLNQKIKANQNEFLRVNQLILFAHHFQYPCVFYETIYNHFKNHLPQNITKNHIRVYYKKMELPSDVPIGLYVNQKCTLEVGYSEFQIGQPYQIVFNNLKKAFCGVNGVKGCDYILKKISKQEQLEKVRKYFEGKSHNLQHQNYVGYEGSHIMLKFFIDGEIIQRRTQVNSSKTILEVIKEFLPEIQKQKYRFQSHGIQLNLNMNSKVFLDDLSYNDGYCYIKIIQN